LYNLGHEIGRNTIKRILLDAGMDPAPKRSKRTSWSDFLRDVVTPARLTAHTRRCSTSQHPHSLATGATSTIGSGSAEHRAEHEQRKTTTATQELEAL
jgi:hypothetical protein